jgi:hypothetical protein
MRLVMALAKMMIVRYPLLRHCLINRITLASLRQAETLELPGEVGESNRFRYTRRALLYERVVEVVEELIRERASRQLGSRRPRSPG